MSPETRDYIGIGLSVLSLLAAAALYVLAARDMKAEAAKLRRLSTVIATALEEAGLARLVRDEHGEIEGIHLERASSDTAAISVTESSYVEKHSDQTSGTP